MAQNAHTITGVMYGSWCLGPPWESPEHRVLVFFIKSVQ